MPDFFSYSSIISTIYDEQQPVGKLGRGAHYSILRSVEWLSATREPMDLPQVHDFAVIWDEDHDTRVIEAIEDIYMAGLLSPVLFIGERKGFLSVIVDAEFYFSGSESGIERYIEEIQRIAQNQTDPWPAEVGSFDSDNSPDRQFNFETVIHSDSARVLTYLRNINSLWSLGAKSFHSNDLIRNI